MLGVGEGEDEVGAGNTVVKVVLDPTTTIVKELLDPVGLVIGAVDAGPTEVDPPMTVADPPITAVDPPATMVGPPMAALELRLIVKRLD